MNKIENILNQSESLFAKDCVDAFAQRKVTNVESTSALSTNEIYEIYAARNKLNERNGAPIKGFGELLRNLKNTKFSEVKIHIVNTGAVDFIVFSNISESQLLGVLKTQRLNADFD